MNFKISK